MQISIISANGEEKCCVTLEKGSRIVQNLMQDNYVKLRFNLAIPVSFNRGDYVRIALNAPTNWNERQNDTFYLRDAYSKRLLDSESFRLVYAQAMSAEPVTYYVTERTTPTYDTSTGAWQYNLRLDAWYKTWNRYILCLSPQYGATSTSFGYTNTFIEHVRIFLINLANAASHGDTTIQLPERVIVEYITKVGGRYYNKTVKYAFSAQYSTITETESRIGSAEIDQYSVQASNLVEDEIKYVNYSNIHTLDAMSDLCSENNYNTEWWFEDNDLHFGRCEIGTPIDIQNDVNAIISRSDSSGEYATRLIAFGGTTNVPARYRKTFVSQITNVQPVSSQEHDSGQMNDVLDDTLSNVTEYTSKSDNREVREEEFELANFSPLYTTTSIAVQASVQINNCVSARAIILCDGDEIAHFDVGEASGQYGTFDESFIDHSGDVLTTAVRNITATASTTLQTMPSLNKKITLRLIANVDIDAIPENNSGATIFGLSSVQATYDSYYTESNLVTFCDSNRLITTSDITGQYSYQTSIKEFPSIESSEYFHSLNWHVGGDHTLSGSKYFDAGYIRVKVKGTVTPYTGFSGNAELVVTYRDISASSTTIARFDNVSSSHSLSIDVTENIKCIGGRITVSLIDEESQYYITLNQMDISITIEYGNRSVSSNIIITDEYGEPILDSSGKQQSIAITMNYTHQSSFLTNAKQLYATSDSRIKTGVYFIYPTAIEDNVPVSYFTDNTGENTALTSLERRIMLPSDSCPKNYIETAIASSDPSQVVEIVHTFEDIYPTLDVPIARVEWFKGSVKHEYNGEVEYTYPINFFIFVRKEDLNFSGDYLIPEKDLQVNFTTGMLAGMTFNLRFDGNVKTTNSDGKSLQRYTIIADTTNGITVPNELLCPTGETNVSFTNLSDTSQEKGDKVTTFSIDPDRITLLNYNAKSIESIGLVSSAEQKLLQQARAYLDKVSRDDGTYTARMFHTFFSNVYSMPAIGQCVTITDYGFFVSPRNTRIIGFDIPLDIEIDSPTYTLGESNRYSRLMAIENRQR